MMGIVSISSIELDLSNIILNRYIPSFSPLFGFHTNNFTRMKKWENGQSYITRPSAVSNRSPEWATTTPSTSGMYLNKRIPVSQSFFCPWVNGRREQRFYILHQKSVKLLIDAFNWLADPHGSQVNVQSNGDF